jgi:hypothetical protein
MHKRDSGLTSKQLYSYGFNDWRPVDRHDYELGILSRQVEYSKKHFGVYVFRSVDIYYNNSDILKIGEGKIIERVFRLIFQNKGKSTWKNFVECVAKHKSCGGKMELSFVLTRSKEECKSFERFLLDWYYFSYESMPPFHLSNK